MMLRTLVISISACSVLGLGDAFGQDIATAAEAIEVLALAQKANDARYPSGEMKVTLIRDQLDDTAKNNDQHEVIEAHSIWSGERVRTELSRWGPSASKPDRRSPAFVQETCILDGTKYILYPGTHVVVIEPIGGQDVSPEYRLTPKHFWYTSHLAESFPAIKAFDKSVIGKDLPNTVISLERPEPGILRLSLKRKTEDVWLDAWFSLDLDGNPTQLDMVDSPSRVKVKMHFTWERDQKGRVLLKTMDRVRTMGGAGAADNATSLQCRNHIF